MTATCPAGHPSATDDYCDTCGVPINAAPEASPPPPPPPAPEAPPESAAVTCPGCGADVLGQFCESCGYDVVAGVPAAASTVTLAIGADRSHWERMVGSGEPAFPDVAPTMTFELTGDRATLGRVRPGGTSDVDLQLSGPGADPAVSQHQCEFVRDPATGTWSVRDTDSANGTWINDADEPLAQGQVHALSAGDTIFMGAWTRLTVTMS